MNMSPISIAAGIAGGTGAVAGFMIKGENAENAGLSTGQQVKNSVIGGISGGMIGAGAAGATAGTVMAIRKILRK
jgi:hypothetical protein